MKIGQNLTYDLPTSMDPEGLTYYTTIESGPSFVSKISDTQLFINPLNCNEDMGDKVIKMKLED